MRAALPDAVRERVRAVAPRAPRDAPFVVYWMRAAVRDHENPALDAAIGAASALGVPVLVYQGVAERYPYASDRHHTFILEGARDVAPGLRARGVGFALHVERPGARGPVLFELCRRAALVVTEDVPVPPLSSWTDRLAARLGDGGPPVWAVDASCVVPLPSLARRPERAFAFRAATRALAEARLRAPWQDLRPAVPAPPAPGPLPFTPVDVDALDDEAIAAIVATCAIDHGVAPVPGTRGGSRAGYARWARFLDGGLAAYARDRDDPSRDGTSRLSPYLHHGHVAPLRIAREAAAHGGPGADKFLDELLVWRELCWHYAAHTPLDQLESLAALPTWARATLAAHAGDPRAVMNDEDLARGRSGDALWDACQRSLLAHGELHNNLRMTWGKALLDWTRDPEAARRALCDLNNRYALDGRDPSSYGGLYYCLGLFDRPFAPERPVLGQVRPRPLAEQARRVDATEYARRVARPTRPGLARVAVIGAGLAGLVCARTLGDHNVAVTVFDKARAPGGRSYARGVRGAVDVFDLGAQYFTARDERFARWVQAWQARGVCAPWTGRLVAVATDGAEPPREVAPLERLVGTPDMNALARHLAEDLDLRAGHRVERLVPQGDGLRLLGTVAPPGVSLRGGDGAAASDLGVFDAVAVCLPAPQAAALVAEVSPALAATAAAIPMVPCLALGVSDPGLAVLPFDGAFIGREPSSSPLSWVARDSSKPGRKPGERWVLHASAAWSQSGLERPDEQISAALLAELARLFDLPPPQPERTVLHRWRYARALSPRQDGAALDPAARLGLGGDWLAGGRVEGAFLSGVALAARVLSIG